VHADGVEDAGIAVLESTISIEIGAVVLTPEIAFGALVDTEQDCCTMLLVLELSDGVSTLEQAVGELAGLLEGIVTVELVMS